MIISDGAKGETRCLYGCQKISEFKSLFYGKAIKF